MQMNEVRTQYSRMANTPSDLKNIILKILKINKLYLSGKYIQITDSNHEILEIVNKNRKLIKRVIRKIDDLDANYKKISQYKKQNNAKLKKAAEKKLDELEKEIVKYQKYIIRKNLPIISFAQKCQHISLTNDEIMIIRYLYVNSEIVLVFNDCGSVFKKLTKRESRDFASLYNYGRHYGITCLNLLQDIMQLYKEIRTAAHNNFFTEAVAATKYFSAADSITKDMKKKAQDCIAKILNDPKNYSSYYKLLYDKNLGNDGFSYVKATHIKPFQFMDKKYSNILKTIESEKSNCLKDNEFKDMFEKLCNL